MKIQQLIQKRGRNVCGGTQGGGDNPRVGGVSLQKFSERLNFFWRVGNVSESQSGLKADAGI